MLTILRPGDWTQEQVEVVHVENRRKIIPEVEASINKAWRSALARPGVNLFDGPLCRMERWFATDDRLILHVSPSTYRSFLGTNMANPQLLDRFGPEVMGNALGVSPALLTSDRLLLLGRRNASLAYYPGRLHPFAGTMEPKDTDAFSAVRRELKEELGFDDSDVVDVRLSGIAQDGSLKQSELIFAVTSTRARAEIEIRLDQTEHNALYAVPATEAGIESALKKQDDLTPVALASLVLWGRLHFGNKWFSRAASDAGISLRGDTSDTDQFE